MFHKDIKPKEKKEIELIIDIVKNAMIQHGYKPERYIPKKRSISIGGEPINKIRLFFKRNDTNYALGIQIYV